ncbi:hypothetical protein [Enterococcus sp. AZ192]|uniref:hypothetical protein n=1 Tax=unclassified Enterococcus TaxID=2608891 RepID=UPI003D281350
MNFEKVIENYGSPVYIYNLNAISKAYTQLKRILPKDSTILYSVKCNNNPGVIRHLNKLGSHFEVANKEEFMLLIKNSVEPSKILFTSPSKTYKEVHYMICHGLSLISCESILEFEMLNHLCVSLNKKIGIFIRLNISSKNSHSSLKMGGSSSQFGIDLEFFLENIDRFKSENVTVNGIHSFFGSNIIDLNEIVSNVEAIVETGNKIERMGISLQMLDLGGGFPAPYASNDHAFELTPLKEKLEKCFMKIDNRKSKKCFFESGRYLTAESGTILGSILYKKVSKGIPYLISDIGIHCLNGFSGSRRTLPPKNDINFRNSSWGEHCYRLVGPSCSPLDIVNSRVETSREIYSGDLFYIKNVGAYGLSSSLLNFLSREVPKEICFYNNQVVSVSQTIIEKSEIEF